MTEKIYVCLCLVVFAAMSAMAQRVNISGKVVEDTSKRPVEFASVLLKECGLWAVTNEEGLFQIQNIPAGSVTLTVQCLGYAKKTSLLNLTRDLSGITLFLKEDNLKLDEVTVTARRKADEATTSYTIDRTTLDNQQILNLSDLQSLLPGGKTVNSTLMSDNRMALRSGQTEKGNASFGTVIEIDGVRMDNNAAMDETMAASTRNLSTANIESVEMVTGIPSVEYGDLSNGIVKVNTRKGKSPFVVEGKINQHTRQIALSKGFDLRNHHGVLNISAEHARSFSDAASPHTTYQRNILSAHYMNVFFRNSKPLTLNAGLTGNIGGYNSKRDPDTELNDYDKTRDNNLEGHIELNWLANNVWLTNLQLKGSVSYADKQSESYYNSSSASTQPYIHTMEEGYHIAQDHDSNPHANVVLGPTGYWYVRRFSDSKPLSVSLKLKADWIRHAGPLLNKLLGGIEYSGSKNHGKGIYYEDMRYAPTWRPYRYNELPTLNNIALYLEDKTIWTTSRYSSLELAVGVRDDITLINRSKYGTVSSLSPRINSRYVFWHNRRRPISDLNIHAGWGKSVKLPSFQVLYPSPSYRDIITFTPASTADNRAYYAVYTHPVTADYNANLRWQYTNQTDFGIEMILLGTRISLSAFHHRTKKSYMSTSTYTPFAYKYTGQSSLEHIQIPSDNRTYQVDPLTGVITVYDKSGELQPVELAYTERRTFQTNMHYVNNSPINRYGLEWVIDFTQIKALRTSLRLDGNYYHYKGIDDILFADIPTNLTTTMSNGQPYGYIGYYRGSNATGTNFSANASAGNGALSRQINLNATVTTHIPRIRLIVSLRFESSLYNYRRQLSELPDRKRGIVLEDNTSYFGEPYDGTSRNKYIAVYPDYYATWDNPKEMIPFAEKFIWASENDRSLYNDLSRLVVKSNYAYIMNPNRQSAYYSANLNITKEIGDCVTVSFYANNFFNNMKRVHSSQTDLNTSLFESGYIPNYYYGLSLRLKI